MFGCVFVWLCVLLCVAVCVGVVVVARVAVPPGCPKTPLFTYAFRKIALLPAKVAIFQKAYVNNGVFGQFLAHAGPYCTICV